jgi:[ribosomal protein S18]-alanine N-acetyltransferase
MFSFLRKQTSYAIRPLGPEAAVDCARLHATAFAHPWSAAEFEALLAAANAVADGALRRTGLVGFALSRRAAGEAELLSIAVSKAERGKGIGAAILNAHLARLGAVGVSEVFLEVEPGNAAALALYHRFGFERAGERKGYYRQGRSNAAPAMTLRCELG